MVITNLPAGRLTQLSSLTAKYKSQNDSGNINIRITNNETNFINLVSVDVTLMGCVLKSFNKSRGSSYNTDSRMSIADCSEFCTDDIIIRKNTFLLLQFMTRLGKDSIFFDNKKPLKLFDAIFRVSIAFSNRFHLVSIHLQNLSY